jgi:putative chitinase
MGLSVRPDQFFKGYREAFGRLNQSQVDGLSFLLDRLETDPHLADVRQAAYVLATVAWETARTFQPIDERGTDAYFNRRYGPQTSVGKRLGNTQAGDGARYHGRGYVQLTGRSNYRRMGERLNVELEAQPELAKDPDTAYRVMSEGMRHGLYTGKKLSDYITAKKADYRSARRIINGLDRADDIAALARDFEEILEGATGSVATLAALPATEATAGESPSGTQPAVVAPAVVAAVPVVPAEPVPGGAVTDPAEPANKQSLVTKIWKWIGAATGGGTIATLAMDKMTAVSTFSPEVQLFIVKGVFAAALLFGVIAVIIAAVDHLQTKYIKARPDLQNTK